MSSIIQAFKNWFRSKKDSAADSMTDPVQDAKFAIEDSRKLVAGFEAKVADLMGHNKRTKLSIDESREEIKKWEKVSIAAGKANSKEDCAMAVKKKLEATRKAEQLEHDYQADEQTIAALRHQLEGAKAKIEHAESNKEVLTARLEGARISEQLQQASTALDAGGPLAALDTLERKTVECETHAQAIEELHTNNSAALEEKYSTSSQDVDDEVAKLMAQSK